MSMKDDIQPAARDLVESTHDQDAPGPAANKSTSSTGKRSACRPERVMAVLGRGRSVVVIGRNLDLDGWLGILSEAISKGRRAKACGLTLEGFLRMLRDFTQR
jgi:hypothetical protein